MAVATVGSRLSGFVRSLVLVWALGTAIFADSFNLANTIPTSIYILVAGGALNSVFMPQLVRAMTRDDDRGECVRATPDHARSDRPGHDERGRGDHRAVARAALGQPIDAQTRRAGRTSTSR